MLVLEIGSEGIAPKNDAIKKDARISERLKRIWVGFVQKNAKMK
jgi:hypothetical protein